MGRDKASLQLEENGPTLLERTASLAATVAPRVLVAGRDCPATWPQEEPLDQVMFVPDDTPQQGPLGGLLTALRQADSDRLLVLSCDLPRLTTEALAWVVREAEHRPALGHGLVAITEEGKRKQPLFAVYSVDQCLPLVEELLQADRRALHALLDAGDFVYLATPPEVEAALANVNTPEDWDATMTTDTRSRAMPPG